MFEMPARPPAGVVSKVRDSYSRRQQRTVLKGRARRVTLTIAELVFDGNKWDSLHVVRREGDDLGFRRLHADPGSVTLQKPFYPAISATISSWHEKAPLIDKNERGTVLNRHRPGPEHTFSHFHDPWHYSVERTLRH